MNLFAGLLGEPWPVRESLQIACVYGERISSLKPLPYIHNHVIELKGNGRASGRCYVEVRDAAKNMDLLGTGYYNDEYVRVGDEWKFQSRSATLV